MPETWNFKTAWQAERSTFYIETLAFGGAVGNGVLVRFGSAPRINVLTPVPLKK
jgi:hypothetical protein